MNLDLFRRTTVVNIKRSKYDVYVGRPGKGYDGKFGNPHTSSRACSLCSMAEGRDVWHAKAEAIELFKKYFYGRVEHDGAFRNEVLALSGKVLGCFCVDDNGGGQCHAKIIAEWVDNQV